MTQASPPVRRLRSIIVLIGAFLLGATLMAGIGALLINILQQSLIRWTSISAFWINAFLGMLILVAIAVDALIMNRVRDLWARTSVTATEADAKHAVTGE